MCWNAAVSLNTFLFSSFVLLLVMYNNAYTKYKIEDVNDVRMYAFIFSFVLMQLIELFIWRNIRNKFYNHVFSVTAAILLLVQPAISLWMVDNTVLRNWLILAYFVSVVPYAVYQLSKDDIHCEVSKMGHLQWQFLYARRPIRVSIWLFFFLFSFFYKKKWGNIIFAVTALIISYLNYCADSTMWSMWCWAVNSLMMYFAIYLLLVLPFHERNKIC